MMVAAPHPAGLSVFGKLEKPAGERWLPGFFVTARGFAWAR